MPTYPNLTSPNAGGSGYSIGSTGGYGEGIGRSSTMPDPDDYPILDVSSGRMVSAKTGKLWRGQQRTSKAPGQGAAPATSTGTGSGRYDTFVDPRVTGEAGAQQDLLSSFKKGASDSLKGFDDYMNDFKGAESIAIGASRRAADIGPVEADLHGQQSSYASDLGRTSRDYAALNADTAARYRDIIGKEYSDVDDYRKIMDRAEAVGLGTATQITNRYGAGMNKEANANLGGGGEIAGVGVREALKAVIPIELAKADRLAQVRERELRSEGELGDIERGRISQFEPYVAGQTYQTGTETSRYLQGLRQAVATQDWDTAGRILNFMGVPQQMRQRILAGDISALSALTNLAQQQRVVQDRYSPQLEAPVYFSSGTGRYPGPNIAPLPANNAPQRVGPGAGGSLSPGTGGIYGGTPQSREAYKNISGYYPEADPHFSQELLSYLDQQYGKQTYTTTNLGPQNNSVWDAQRGAFVDRNTGEITGYGPTVNYPGADESPFGTTTDQNYSYAPGVTPNYF